VARGSSCLMPIDFDTKRPKSISRGEIAALRLARLVCSYKHLCFIIICKIILCIYTMQIRVLDKTYRKLGVMPPILAMSMFSVNAHLYFTSDKGGGKCVCPRSFVCLSVC